MAEMNTTTVGVDLKKRPVEDAGNFAEHIERQANTLAEFGWTREATHLRRWAAELKGRSIRSDYAGERSLKTVK